MWIQSLAALAPVFFVAAIALTFLFTFPLTHENPNHQSAADK